MKDFESFKTLTTKEKALQLNLNEKIYGTVAEIGGGQEVASHFFKAGAASGTIAKTMSAYDMKFSDAIYGKSERYVCQDKLNKMLNREYTLLSERLTHRIKKTNFFAFANTVETLNFKKSNESHGWLGIRFQRHSNTDPNECIIHVLLKDNDAQWQQELLGILGVNLIHACFYYTEPEEIMLALRDNISHDRLEIDMFKISGPDFHHVDNRLMSLLLVKHKLTNVALFGPNGNVLQASEILYKKNVLILRGRFRPITNVLMDMIDKGYNTFIEEEDVEKENVVTIAELTLNGLTVMEGGEVDENDFLDRVDLICSLGQTVAISSYQEHYKLAAYLSKLTRRAKIAIICGYGNLQSIFNEEYYTNLSGGILESFSRLFSSNVKLLVYPMLNNDKSLSTSENFEPKKHLVHLYKYFKENQQIVDIKNVDSSILNIISDNVLGMIQKGKKGWEIQVPKTVSELIKEKGIFGYQL